MHISEGILSAPILLGGGLLSAAGTAIGLKQMHADRIMPTAILSAAFFVASLIHVPLGPGSVHLVLNGLLGLILGWGCFPAILVGLFLQAIFFQYGGLLVLGVNVFTMAAPAVILHYLARPFLVQEKTRAVASFGVGFLAILGSAILMALALALTSRSFLHTARLVVVAHLPIMVCEGIITMFAVSFLHRVQPEIIFPPEDRP